MAKALDGGNPKATIRNIIGRLTNGGEDVVLNIVRIANGMPITMKLDDGRELGEPLVPTPAVMLAANQWLAEQLGGKAVMQGEVERKASETALIDKLKSLSDEELAQRVRELEAGQPLAVEGEVVDADDS